MLGALGVTSIAGLTLEACSKTSPECTKPSSTPPSSITSPPSLAQLRALIRASPDHLQARAEEVVVTKNPKCIAEFVRDHIAVLPGFQANDDGTSTSRWGIEGTLRAGAGTLRDRAELMVALLGAAGIPAKVRLIDTPSGLTTKELYRPLSHEFSVGENNLKGMVEAIQKERDARNNGSKNNQTLNEVRKAETDQPTGFGKDADPAALVEAAAKVITAAIEGKMDKLPNSELPLPRHIPVVAIKNDAATVLVALGSTAIRTDVKDTAKLNDLLRYPLPTIEFSVTAFLNPRPGGGRPRVTELLNASWPVKDVVGRQVQVLFPPPQGSDALLQAPLSSYPARIPFIRVQPRPSGKLDVRQFDFGRVADTTAAATATNPATSSDQATTPLVATGSLFTIDGEVLVDTSTKEQAKDPAIVSLDEKQSELESQRVAKIDATVNTASFPDIEIMLSVTDAKGQAIDGLGMSAFQVSDGGRSCQPILVANRQVQRKPRVLVLYDGSGSVTESFGSDEHFKSFNHTVAQALVDAAATQPFETQVVSMGGGSSESAWQAPSIDSLTKELGHFSWSALWTSFTNGALDDGPAAIVVVSDFDANDSGEAPAAKVRLAQARIPIIAITTGKVNESVLAELMTATGGHRFIATDPKLKYTLSELVVKAAKKQMGYSYRFHYKAKPEDPNPRTVKVALRKRPQIHTSVNYAVPVENERVLPASVTGLYLTISVGGVTERRRLGGIEFSDRGHISQDPFDQALIAEARNALNGLTTVTVEPASPTLGAVLEDVVTSFQSMEPLVAKKWTKDDTQAFKAAAAKVYRYPMDLAQLLAPPPVSYSDPNVVPQGLRILVSTEQPQDNTLVSWIDIPPGLNQLRISGGNPRVVSSVVRSSLWLSANEALTYDQSAFAQLQSRPMHLIDRHTGAGSIPEEIAKRFSPEAAARLRRVADQYIDYIRLVPTDGGSVAMWIINHESGTVMAVGETGRGEGHSVEEDSDGVVFAKLVWLQLSVLAIWATAACESGGEAKAPWACVGVAVGSIALTAATALALRHYDVVSVVGESIVLGNGLLGIYHTVQNELTKDWLGKDLYKELFGSSHTNHTKQVILMCMLHIALWLRTAGHVMEGVSPKKPSKNGRSSSEEPPINEPTTGEAPPRPEVCKNDTGSICEFHPPMAPSPTQ